MVNLIGISGRKGAGKNLVAAIIQHIVDSDFAKKHGTKPGYASASGGGLMGEIGYIKAMNDTYHRQWSRYQIKSFAWPLKYIAGFVAGVDPLNFESESFKNCKMDDNWKHWRIYYPDGSFETFLNRDLAYDRFSQPLVRDIAKMEEHLPTYREFLQLIGTDCFRNIIHPQTWIIAAFRDYKESNQYNGRSRYDEDTKCMYIPPSISTPKQFWENTMVPNTDAFALQLETSELPYWIFTDARFENEIDAVKQRGGIILRIERPDLPQIDLHPSETALDNYPFEHLIINGGPNVPLEELYSKVFIWWKTVNVKPEELIA